MQQVLIGGCYDTLPSSTKYSRVLGAEDGGGTEQFHQAIASADGVFKNLYVELSTAPGADEFRDCYINVNGAHVGGPTVHIEAEETSGSDLVNELAVSAGDLISICFVPSAAPAAVTYAKWSVMFESTNAKESLILGGVNNALTNDATEYNSIMGGAIWTAAIADRYQVIPTNGAISDLYVNLSDDPGETEVDAYKFTLMIGEVAQELTCTVTADDTTGNDTVHSVAVSPGDLVTLRCEPLNVPSVQPIINWGMKFTSAIDGESIILGGSADDIHDTDTEYNYPTNGLDGYLWNPTEAQITALAQACTMRKFYVQLENAPSDGRTVTLASRVAGGAGNLSVAITGAATNTGSDLVHSDVLVAGNEFHISCTPNNTPVVGRAYWGIASYIPTGAPPVVEKKHTFRLDPKPRTRAKFYPSLKLGG